MTRITYISNAWDGFAVDHVSQLFYLYKRANNITDAENPNIDHTSKNTVLSNYSR